MAGDEGVRIETNRLFAAFQSLKDAQKEEKEVLPEITKKLANLQTEPGWEELKKIIENQIVRLKELSEAVESGMTVEEVGFRFLASRVAISYLENIISLVENSAKNVRQREE